ncbi:MAG: cache domain-containing protein [Candidatus Thiodiazotropha sp. (ex Dulcina madagascariensis)]|nr:cache domain-containing protein [Candidatus Thiodiazotropha sp. (ex Dulcina madagascariensis)]
MNNTYKLGLRGKITLSLGLMIFLSLLATSLTSYYQSQNVAKRKVMELEQSKLSLLKHGIEGALNEHRNILMSLQAVPAVQGIIRARANNGIDPISEDTLEIWLDRLSTIFTAFLLNHPQYLQLRYIDIDGNELVRVEKNGDVKVVSGDALQNKSGSLYVTETLKLKAGDIYHSDVNLNREHGAIQVPHVPVLRMATPVHSVDKHLAGLIVMNLATERLFSGVHSKVNEVQRYIVDNRGYFIKYTGLRGSVWVNAELNRV